MKYIKKYENKYLSDKEIEDSYNNYKITSFSVSRFFDDENGNECYTCGAVGWIDIEFEYDEENDYAESKSDNWIKYNSGPRIAFDHWYPPKMSKELKEYIEEGIKLEAIKRKAEKYNL